MKRIITVVSAAAATLVVMVAVGAGSASAATVLCDTYETPCQTNAIESAGSYVITGDTEGYPGLQVSASGGVEFECGMNVMEAESTATIGEPLSSNFYGSLASCVHLGKTSCSGSMNSPSTTLQGQATGGLMKIGTASDPLALTFVCAPTGGGSYTCTYKMTETLNLDVQETEAKALFKSMYLVSGSSGNCSGGTPRISVRNQNFTEGPNDGNFISKYTPTGSVLCKTGEVPCVNKSNQYGSGTSLQASLKAGTTATITNPIIKSECSTSALGGQLTGSGGAGSSVPFEISSASFSGCSNYSTYSVENLPWSGQFFASEVAGTGTVKLSNVRLKFSRLGVVCVLGGDVYGSVNSNSEIVFSSAKLSFISGSGLCSGGGSLTATYSISAPNPFNLSWI